MDIFKWLRRGKPSKHEQVMKELMFIRHAISIETSYNRERFQNMDARLQEIIDAAKGMKADAETTKIVIVGMLKHILAVATLPDADLASVKAAITEAVQASTAAADAAHAVPAEDIDPAEPPPPSPAPIDPSLPQT